MKWYTIGAESVSKLKIFTKQDNVDSYVISLDDRVANVSHEFSIKPFNFYIMLSMKNNENMYDTQKNEILKNENKRNTIKEKYKKAIDELLKLTFDPTYMSVDFDVLKTYVETKYEEDLNIFCVEYLKKSECFFISFWVNFLLKHETQCTGYLNEKQQRDRGKTLLISLKKYAEYSLFQIKEHTKNDDSGTNTIEYCVIPSGVSICLESLENINNRNDLYDCVKNFYNAAKIEEKESLLFRIMKPLIPYIGEKNKAIFALFEKKELNEGRDKMQAVKHVPDDFAKATNNGIEKYSKLDEKEKNIFLAKLLKFSISVYVTLELNDIKIGNI